MKTFVIVLPNIDGKHEYLTISPTFEGVVPFPFFLDDYEKAIVYSTEDEAQTMLQVLKKRDEKGNYQIVPINTK